MKIAFFVHDCHLEIGHSRAQIEMIRNIPKEKLDSLVIVSFTCSPLDKLFPEHFQKARFIKIPSPLTKPLLLKSIFYQLICMVYCKIALRDYLKIGIGICCLHVDVANIQFLHWPWSEHYFRETKLTFLTKIYKKILFAYFDLCEKIIFQKENVRIFCLSKFITNMIHARFPNTINRSLTIYSGLNLNEFNIKPMTREMAIASLISDYPSLAKIDQTKPILLFIGAHQRKGLPVILRELPKDMQLIAIGKSEKGQEIDQDKYPNVVFIDHTKRVDAFYQLCDVFVFPTIYEPFGLVLTEAAAMGLKIITYNQEVGASEILGGLSEIYLINRNGKIPFHIATILNIEEKIKLRNERLVTLKQYSWHHQSELFYEFIEKRSS